MWNNKPLFKHAERKFHLNSPQRSESVPNLCPRRSTRINKTEITIIDDYHEEQIQLQLNEQQEKPQEISQQEEPLELEEKIDEEIKTIEENLYSEAREREIRNYTLTIFETEELEYQQALVELTVIDSSLILHLYFFNFLFFFSNIIFFT